MRVLENFLLLSNFTIKSTYKVIKISCSDQSVLTKMIVYVYCAKQVEELRASERNLRVRVKSLTNELAVYKRYKTHICLITDHNSR